MKSAEFFVLVAAMLVAGVCLGAEPPDAEFDFACPLTIHVSWVGEEGYELQGCKELLTFTSDTEGATFLLNICEGGGDWCSLNGGVMSHDYWLSVDLGYQETTYEFAIDVANSDETGETVEYAYYLTLYLDTAPVGQWNVGDTCLDGCWIFTD
jgi:hypothetical protein